MTYFDDQEHERWRMSTACQEGPCDACPGGGPEGDCACACHRLAAIETDWREEE